MKNPFFRRKEHVSKLDIILEAIKYIDDLQDQLIDRLSGPRLDRESTLLAIASTSSAVSIDNNDVIDCFKMQSDSEDEDDDVFSLSDGYMSDPGLVSATIFILSWQHLRVSLPNLFGMPTNRFRLMGFALATTQKMTMTTIAVAVTAMHLLTCDLHNLNERLKFQQK